MYHIFKKKERGFGYFFLKFETLRNLHITKIWANPLFSRIAHIYPLRNFFSKNYTNVSISPIISPNTCNADSIGAGVSKLTPAIFNNSTGESEQPPERNFL